MDDFVFVWFINKLFDSPAMGRRVIEAREHAVQTKCLDDLQLLLAEYIENCWKSFDVPVDVQKAMLAYHKVQRDFVSSEVIVIPDGRVLMLVMPLAGYQHTAFPAVTHAFIIYQPEKKNWRVDVCNAEVKFKRLHDLKEGMLAEQYFKAVYETLLDRTVTHSSIYDNLTEAYRMACIYVLRNKKLISILRQVLDHNLSGFEPSKSAIEEFQSIKPINSISLTADDILTIALEYAQRMCNVEV